MRTSTRRVLLSILAITAAPLAHADVSVNVKSETVRYDDLRLISNVGAAVLYGRLRAAAERVCGGPVDATQISQHRRFRACVDEAITNAVADVNHPVLTQFVAAKRNSTNPSTSTANVSAVAKTP